MTSKEAFIKIREIMNEYHHQFVKENIKLETIDGYPLDQIEKDLEILDVFKSIIKIVENDKYTYGNKKYIIKLRNDVILNDALLEIIKEWLEK